MRYRNLLVPYDFSEHSQAALETAVDLARRLHADQLHLVHVLQPPALLYPTLGGMFATARPEA